MADAYVPVATFAFVIALIFKQPILKIPFTEKKLRIDYGIAPLLGVGLLLATFSISQATVFDGILGDSTIQPYAILILFFALAYICLSLDATGLFRYLALCASQAASGSGKRLFLYFFGLSSFLTMFTSNDIVILTMTPIIYYFAKETDSDPVPFLIAQFFAANIWSVALFTGNPTNIIVAQAFEVTFLEFFVWMILPAIAAGTSCIALLFLLFRKHIPERIVRSEVDPRNALKDRGGAVFGVVCLVTCLAVLNLSQWLGLPIWQVCLSFCFVVAVRDAFSRKSQIIEKGGKGGSSLLVCNLRRVPWKILPFMVGLFILVESLSIAGVIRGLASGLSGFLGIDIASSTFGIALFSSVTANLMNNQPMTVLFTRVLQNIAFVTSVQAERAGFFALVLGSNFGANLTLFGSLAGLMWIRILKDKGVALSFGKFSKYGMLIMPTVILSACLILFLEVVLWS